MRNGIGLQITAGTATASGNTFSDNTTGVLIAGGTGNISSNTFTGGTTAIQANAGADGSISNNTITTATGGTALNISAGFLGTASGNTATGGGLNAIYVPGGTQVSGTVTWGQVGLPYFVDLGGVQVNNGGALTIAPGVIVKFQKGPPSCCYTTAYLQVQGGGSLTANGTVAQPITFTSYLDDAAGGDTNGDGSATTAAAGDWSGIRFENGATGAISNAVIRYGGNGAACCGAGPVYAALDVGAGAANQPALGSGLQITDSVTGIAVNGSGTNETISGVTLARNGIGVRVDSGAATINGNTLTGNATGILVNGGTGTVTGNTITGSTTGIQANAGAAGSIANNTITTASGGTALNISAGFLGTASGNTATGGGLNAIYVPGGTQVTGAVTWGQVGLPYFVDLGGVQVNNGGALTIAPGVIVKFQKGPPSCCYTTAYLQVQGGGSLTANGTAAQPITFTSYLDDAAGGDTNRDGSATTAAAGDWSGIRFENGATGAISNAVIRYGGNGAACCGLGPVYAALDVGAGAANQPALGSGLQITDSVTGIAVNGSGTNETISGVTLARNGVGVRLDSGAAVINGSTLTGNTTGILAGAGANGNIANNTITTASGGKALNISAGFLGTVSGNTATGGGLNAVYVSAGTQVTGAVTWGAGLPYLVDLGGVQVNNGGALTISPGVIVKFQKAPPSCCYTTAFLLVQGGGSLTANGTVAQPITFTSYLDDAAGGDTNGDGAATTPAMGDWSGIRFENGATGSISNAVIRYGGNGAGCCGAGPNYAALDIGAGAANQPALGSALQITDNATGIAVNGSGTNETIGGVTLARNGIGVRVDSGAATINGNALTGNTTGILVNGGTGTVTGNTITGSTTGIQANAGAAGSISNNTITTVSGGAALNISAGFLGTTSGNTATGGGLNAIYVPGGTQVSGAVTWGQVGLPYFVDLGGVQVNNGGALTISPGVIVKFQKVPPSCCYTTAFLLVQGGGSLTANGTVAQPITFTSYLDDAAGGDTNGDGAATMPAVGDWSGIRFESGATGAISNAVIRYGGNGAGCCGAGPNYAALDIGAGAANQPALGSGLQITDNATGIAVNGSGTNETISGVTLARNGIGVRVDSGAATINGNTLTGNTTGILANAGATGNIANNTIATSPGGKALNISAGFLGTVSGNTATGGGLNAVYVSAGTQVTGAVTWGAGLPYFVDLGGVQVNNGGALTISPGVIVKFQKAPPSCCYTTAFLLVQGGGSLTANGTSAQPITFTSYLDDAAGGDTNGDGAATTPAMGDWSGIRFENGATGSISNAVIRYGGNGAGCCGAGPNYAALDIGTGSAQPIFASSVQITDNATGMMVTGSGTAPTIGGASFKRNGTAVHTASGAAPVITGNDIEGNGFGVQNDDSSVTINATNNFWGAATGPSGAGPGTGDKVSAYVNFSPFSAYSVLAPPPNQPAISVSPASIDFGNVTVNSSLNATVTITSTGTADLSITAISAPDAPFILNNLPSLPFSLPPNSTQSFTVTFAPTATSGSTGSFVITSNAAGAPSTTVSLAGTGAPPSAPAAAAITVNTDKTVYTRAQPVQLSGNVSASGSAPLANVPVLLQVSIAGFSTSLTATTNSQGNYTATFQPNSTQSGSFTVTASASSGGVTQIATRTFRIVGLFVTPVSTSSNQVMGTSQSTSFTLQNLGDATVNSISASVSGGVSGITASITPGQVPSTLGAGESASFNVTVTAPAGTPPGTPVTFNIQASGTDSVTGIADQEAAVLTVTFHPSTSVATVLPASATIGINPGSTAIQSFTVRNDGYVSITNAAVAVQGSAPTWVTLNNATLGSIAPGASVTFQVNLNPPSNQAAGTYVVQFNITGGSVASSASVSINVTSTSVGSAVFVVSDDNGDKVNGATITLVNKTTSSTFQGATDATGQATISGVDPGVYSYTVAAPVHDPATGTVTVSPGTATAPENVILTLDVVNLNFTVTPTTIVDQYNVSITVTYTTTLTKPALQVLPYYLQLSNFPENPYKGQLTIRNTNPSTPVNNVVVDASQLDLALPSGQRMQIVFANNAQVFSSPGVLAPNASITVPFTATVASSNLTSRTAGNIVVQANYMFSLDGQALPGTTSATVPVSYVQPQDLNFAAIQVTNDQTTGDPNNLTFSGTSFLFPVVSNRNVLLNLLSPPTSPYNNQELVAFINTAGGQTAESLVSGNAANAFWRTNFSATKRSLTAQGDSTDYDISVPDSNGQTLLAALANQLATNRSAFLSNPSYLAFQGQWSDRNSPNTYLIPIVVTTILPGSVTTTTTGGNGCGWCGGGSGGSATTGGGTGSPPPAPALLPQNQGQIVIAIDSSVRLERQAFNATLGIGARAPLTNVVTQLQIKSASGQDASSNFFIILTSDQSGATRGGSISGSSSVSWQLVPASGAGGTTPQGQQYTVIANMSYMYNGQPFSASTSAIITVLPSAKLTVTYSLPYVVIATKPAKMRVTIQNVGYGTATNLVVGAAQPQIVSNTTNLPISFNISGSSNTANGNTFQAGAMAINFGNVAPGATVSGYWAVNTTQSGFFVAVSSTFTQQPYQGVTLDAIVNPPTTTLVPAIGGTVTNTAGQLYGGVWMSLAQGSTVIARDTTNASGAYYMQDLSPGVYTLTATTIRSGDISQDVTVLSGQPTNFINFVNSIPFTAPPGTTINPAAFASEPVNTATGAYYATHTDLAVPGRGISFAFTRYYNSSDRYQGPLGAGWTHSFNAFLIPDAASGIVTLNDTDGSEVQFAPLGGGAYSSITPGEFDTLRKNGDSSFSLTRKNQTVLNFSSQGRLASIVDRNGNTQTLTYTGSNLTAIVDSSGRTFLLAYDTNNRLTSLTDPLSRVLRYGYDAAGNLTSFHDALGGTTQYAYDSSSRMTSATDPCGNVYLQNTYDSQGRVATQKNALGAVTTFAYNTPSQGTTSITDPLGNVTKHVYDANQRVISEIDAANGTTAYTYAVNNLRLTTTDPLGRVQTFAYDANGNVTSVTDPNGKSSTFVYDLKNNLLQATDRLSRTTTLAYDGKGNLVSSTDPAGNSSTFTYDSYGEVLTAKNARGFITSFQYDSAGNLATTTDALSGAVVMTYDAVGRLTTVKNQLGNTASRSYDANNRLTTVTDPLGNSTQFAYDGNGNLVTITDANGNVTQYAYDPTNKLRQVTDAIGGITKYQYNANTDLTSVTDANGHATTYSYDALRRLIATTDPLNRQKQYGYDAVGNITNTIDGNNKTNTFGYDSLNRLASMALSDGNSVAYTYDAVGNRLTMVDWRGTTSYGYDAMNRVTSVATPDGKTVGYSYDSVGNRATLTYPDGKVVQYTYDGVNRLTKVTDWAGKATNYTYDAAGSLAGFTHPNGAASTYQYDAANRLLNVTNKTGTKTLSSFTYVLDKVGNRMRMTTSAGGVSQYGYDDHYRLISWTPSSGQATQWTYDSVGNRLTMTSSTGTTNYAYDAADEMLTAGTTSYTYDGNGNQLTRLSGSAKTTYSWDALNRLISVVTGNNTTIYQYDGDGSRTAQQIGAGTYTYINDTAAALPSVLNENGPDGSITYLYGGSLISETSSAFQYYYQFDGVGSAINLTDQAGASRANYSYDPWGRMNLPLDPLGSKNKYKFTAEPVDSAGLLYLRTRYYDSAVGRFLSPDKLAQIPHHESGGAYQYARSNPGRFTDPAGLSAIEPAQAFQNSISSPTSRQQFLDHYDITAGNKVIGVALGDHNTLVALFMFYDPRDGNLDGKVDVVESMLGGFAARATEAGWLIQAGTEVEDPLAYEQGNRELLRAGYDLVKGALIDQWIAGPIGDGIGGIVSAAGHPIYGALVKKGAKDAVKAYLNSQ